MTHARRFWDQIPERLQSKLELHVETDLHGISQIVSFRLIENPTVVATHKFPADLPVYRRVFPDEFIAKLCVLV